MSMDVTYARHAAEPSRRSSTLLVHFDRDVWVHVPSTWPWMRFPDQESWRSTLVSAVGDSYGYDTADRVRLAQTVEGISRGAQEHELRFAHFAEPERALGIASVYEWAPTPSTSTDALLALSDPRAVWPPIVSDIHSPHLGAGRKSIRWVSDPVGGAVTVVAHWVWRLPDREIVMIAGDGELARFQSLQPDFDALARSIAALPG